MTELLFIIIGFCATFIGTLAGSGGLIGMPSLLLIGIPIHSVIATTKFSNILASLSSFFHLLRAKELQLNDVLNLFPFALFGGLAGGLLANAISEQTMNLIAIILLSSAFALSFIKKPLPKQGGSWKLPKKAYPSLFGISIYDGMFGPGQASMLMYTFLQHGASYIKALAFTRFQTFTSCSAAFVSYLASGNFMWEIALYYTLGSLIGAQLAVRAARRISTRHLKVILHIVTIGLILQLMFRLIM